MAKKKKATKNLAKKPAKKVTKKSPKKATKQMTKKTTKKVTKKTATKKTTAKANKKPSAKKTTLKAKKSKKSVTQVMREILEKQQAHHNPIQAELLGEEVNSDDPAKAPGHRNLDIKGTSSANPADSARSESARQNLTRADKVNRNTSAQRRIITGAAVGKTGRIVNK